MRYFIQFWVVLATFFIFSDKLQAADVVDNSEKVTICNPIEPIEPNTVAARANIWQKTKQQLRLLRKRKGKPTTVDPIEPHFYKLMGAVTILECLPYGLFTFVALISGLVEFGMASAIWPLLFGLFGLLGLVFIIFYIIKLFRAAQAREDKFMKGKRFMLGYIAIAAIFVIWSIAISAFMYGLTGWGGAPVLTIEIIASGLILGLLACLPLLIFNIIDHLRYRKYLKEQV